MGYNGTSPASTQYLRPKRISIENDGTHLQLFQQHLHLVGILSYNKERVKSLTLCVTGVQSVYLGLQFGNGICAEGIP